ncbi:hypothetical protein EON76_01845 [bacterium]|nr:MAG: hypothetical protein EON76_01845 [bacterium]
MDLSHVANQLLVEFPTTVAFYVAGDLVYDAASMTAMPYFFPLNGMKSLAEFESVSAGFSPTTEVLVVLQYSHPLRMVVLSTTVDNVQVTPVRAVVACSSIRIEENVRPSTYTPMETPRSLTPSDSYVVKGEMTTSLPFSNPLNISYDPALFRSLEEAALVVAS